MLRLRLYRLGNDTRTAENFLEPPREKTHAYHGVVVNCLSIIEMASQKASTTVSFLQEDTVMLCRLGV